MSVVACSSPIPHRPQASSILSFPQASISSLPFPTPTIRLVSSNIPRFPRHALSHSQNGEEEDDDDPVIGDCLVFDEGAFDGSFPQRTRNSGNPNSREKGVSTENLIPDEWLDVQKEINITKKERRKLAQQLEYGRRVEKRRQAYMPINSEEYEKIKNEKLRQLNPVVLDNPDPKCFRENEEDDEGYGNDTAVRVTPRNPRLSVYGKGYEDISELFQSGRYVPDNSQGTRKLFSKEEKMLVNSRVPNIAVATSGKWHPLHSLAASGEFYLVTSLLKHNADINSPNKDGLTTLHKSILGRKQAIFNFLLRESANPFVRDNDGATLMHYAVRVASSQMIKIMLLYNVDINLQDNNGWTPLHLAVQSLRTDIVRLLLIKGADKTLKNRDGLTPLDLCLYSGSKTRTYELIKLLKLRP